jgi:hypothetical protein
LISAAKAAPFLVLHTALKRLCSSAMQDAVRSDAKDGKFPTQAKRGLEWGTGEISNFYGFLLLRFLEDFYLVCPTGGVALIQVG